MRNNFLWGVATSAFQLEGSPHADWASWDSILGSKPDFTNHYVLYKEDLCLLKELGVNDYLFLSNGAGYSLKKTYGMRAP